jgi:hypothetical protein
LAKPRSAVREAGTIDEIIIASPLDAKQRLKSLRDKMKALAIARLWDEHDKSVVIRGLRRPKIATVRRISTSVLMEPTKGRWGWRGERR